MPLKKIGLEESRKKRPHMLLVIEWSEMPSNKKGPKMLKNE